MTPTAIAEPIAPTGVPPLCDGDRLGRAEFLRRWEADPDLKFAERIEGVVHSMASPVAVFEHGGPVFQLGWCLQNYAYLTIGTWAYSEGTTLIDRDNDFQPDAALIVLPEFGGQARRRGKFLEGAPELAAEIAATTAARDLGVKLQVYRRNGTREYIVWRTVQKKLEVFTLSDDGEYVPAPREQGVWKSACFPGLWIHVAGLLSEDFPAVRNTANAGLESPEHVAFAAELAGRQ